MNGGDGRGTLEKPSGFSLAMNLLPAVHLVGGIAIAMTAFDAVATGGVFLAVWIYAVPPLAGRALIAMFGRPEGRLTQDMSSYRVWWVLTQLQAIFNRLPFLEELLRLIPGVYPLWIALWGGRLSPFAYVGPGVIITDRYAVDVGAGAVLGFNSALAGHMAVRDEQGRFVVVVGAPTVEAEAMLGGAAGLGPGARLKTGHVLPTGRRVRPFDSWPRQGPDQGAA